VTLPPDPAVTTAAADEIEAVLDLIAAEQEHPDRGTTMLGETRDGIRAELGDVEPDWRASLRVARADGHIVGAVVGDWDAGLGRAWILGPWVPGDDDEWRRWARPLVDAVLEQLPAGIDDWELAADVSHVRMAALGAELGLPPSEPSHVYSVEAAALDSWPEPAVGTRPASAADVEMIRPLHDAEFPASYATADQLVPDPPDGKYQVVVAMDGPVLLGYAAGRVQADGEGYLDFLAVADVARGRGTGKALMWAICRPVLSASTTGTLHLTVQDHRAPARRLYESLGFTRSLSIVGYRHRTAG
jgi:ribosomal protein S18 acetylase RimI-like enzyme